MGEVGVFYLSIRRMIERRGWSRSWVGSYMCGGGVVFSFHGGGGGGVGWFFCGGGDWNVGEGGGGYGRWIRIGRRWWVHGFREEKSR